MKFTNMTLATMLMDLRLKDVTELLYIETNTIKSDLKVLDVDLWLIPLAFRKYWETHGVGYPREKKLLELMLSRSLGYCEKNTYMLLLFHEYGFGLYDSEMFRTVFRFCEQHDMHIVWDYNAMNELCTEHIVEFVESGYNINRLIFKDENADPQLGLYSMLWGKLKEPKRKTEAIFLELSAFVFPDAIAELIITFVLDERNVKDAEIVIRKFVKIWYPDALRSI